MNHKSIGRIHPIWLTILKTRKTTKNIEGPNTVILFSK